MCSRPFSTQETIGAFIKRAANLLADAEADSPRLSAELILAHALDVRREYLLTHPERILSDAESRVAEDMLRRRALGEPVAYLLGRQEFYGREFLVNKHTLIPRPETELLVDLALEAQDLAAPGLIVDLGAGSGCILLTLLCEMPGRAGLGADISAPALAVAGENARRLGVDGRCAFMLADMTAPVFKKHSLGLLVSNPPYISPGDYATLSREVAGYEPQTALLSPQNGLHHLAALEELGRESLAPGGILLLEMGNDQGQSGPALFDRAPQFWDSVEMRRDLAGLPRIIRARRSLVC